MSSDGREGRVSTSFPALHIESGYFRSHLPEWQAIEPAVVELLDSFNPGAGARLAAAACCGDRPLNRICLKIFT